MRTLSFPSGDSVQVLGQGTWRMGHDPGMRQQEVAALRLGMELGMTLIDTAESYDDGGAEKVVAEAIAGHRDEVFLVSKLHPKNSAPADAIASCEASLRRLGTDRLDLYLLHWREPDTRLPEVVEALQKLQADGKVRSWGMSAMDVADMDEVWALPGGHAVATDQVLYNLEKRGIEQTLIPWCQQREIPIMAYSPLGCGDLSEGDALSRIAAEHGVAPATIALAWVLRSDKIVAIPKASSEKHVRANRAALDVHLHKEDLAALDKAFPPPTDPSPLVIFHSPADEAAAIAASSS